MGNFQILEPSTSSLSVEQGATGQMTFTVRNTGDSFRNLGVRVAVLNAVGDEDAGAGATAWFTAQGPGEAFVPAGGEVQATVTVAVPADAPVGDVTFRLVAFDSDLADEDVSEGPAATLTVTEKAAPPPPPTPGIPFWVWIIVGVGALALVIGIIVAVVNSNGDDDDDTTTTTDDDDSGEVVVDDDDSTVLPVGPVRRLDILFKAYEGNDPLAGPLSGAVIKLESSIDATATLTTNADGDARHTLCVVQDATAEPGFPCTKVRDSLSMRATKAGYKNTPTSTLDVGDLVEAPKTYVELVPNSSSSEPIRPWVVEDDGVVNLKDYLEKIRPELLGDGRFGRELLIEVNIATELALVSVPADQKLEAIKIVREYTGLGLKESKELVDAVMAGRPMKLEGLTSQQISAAVKRFQAIGAKTKTK